MVKRYFGSRGLQNTVRKVKTEFPECKISYKEEDNIKTVSFKFDPEERKKYKLSDGFRTYHFRNDHLILSNGYLDPFKYDRLDMTIEKAELDFDVEKAADSVTKIRAALAACQEFHDSAVIMLGNKSGYECDIKFVLNDIERVYHMNMKSEDVHLEKLDPETEINGGVNTPLKRLKPEVVFKILKTTHPGLLTKATEYISGIREDKAGWTSAEDAYVKAWKKQTYESFGLKPLDVLIDIPDSRLVGKFVKFPMRHLILIDGSEYAYTEFPLEAIPFEEYAEERNVILTGYKKDVMYVCKETGVIPQNAIEMMNTYKGNAGPVVLMDADEAIRNIRLEKLTDPLVDIVKKLNRSMKLYDHKPSFTITLRKQREACEVRRIDINENGFIARIDINMVSASVSEPYTMYAGKKKEVEKKTKYMTAFLEALDKELNRARHEPEYFGYIYAAKMKMGGFKRKGFIDSENKYLIEFEFPDSNQTLWMSPYDYEIGINNESYVLQRPELIELINVATEIFNQLGTLYDS